MGVVLCYVFVLRLGYHLCLLVCLLVLILDALMLVTRLHLPLSTCVEQMLSLILSVVLHWIDVAELSPSVLRVTAEFVLGFVFCCFVSALRSSLGTSGKTTEKKMLICVG